MFLKIAGILIQKGKIIRRLSRKSTFDIRKHHNCSYLIVRAGERKKKPWPPPTFRALPNGIQTQGRTKYRKRALPHENPTTQRHHQRLKPATKSQDSEHRRPFPTVAGLTKLGMTENLKLTTRLPSHAYKSARAPLWAPPSPRRPHGNERA